MEKHGWFGEFRRQDGQDWVMGSFDRMTCMPGCLGFIQWDLVIHSSYIY